MAYPIWQATITDDNGNVLPGAEITVVNETTGLNAQLYSTRNGTSKTNPFFATADGFAQFHAEPGLYRITATDGGTGTTQTFRYVRLVEVATTAEAIAGTAGVLPDAAGVKAHVDSRVTQSATDTTEGRLLKVGDFGVTNGALDGSALTDFADDLPRGSVVFARTDVMSQLPPPSGSYVVSTYGNLSLTSAIWQTALHRETATLFTRIIGEAGWHQLYHSGNLGAASETAAGIVELATAAETQAGTDNSRAVTPAGLASRTATESRAGIVKLATAAEAQAGTDGTRALSPLRLRDALNASGSATMFACRAWVNFDGTTTPPTIRASGNVSSVTRNGTGDYTVNFTTAMPDANYAATVTASVESAQTAIPVHNQHGILDNSSGSYRFRLSEAHYFPAQRDSTNCYVAIFR